MTMELFLACPPGFEPTLAAEAREAGFKGVAETPGGVTCAGDWAEVWRANLVLRGATRVLARVEEFRAFHLAQLDKRAQKVDWAAILPKATPVKVEVTSRKSKIYHAGAAAQRIEKALTDSIGAVIDPEAAIKLKVRIDDNLVTFSIDTSGESLHKRGHKVAVNKAPLRETLAALCLRACGFDGTQTVLDPMCGSGTFPIEAAEWAAGLMPGRDRRFAFEDLPSFDAASWARMKTGAARPTSARFYGSDRDAGAVRMAQDNAGRAGVDDICLFECKPISDIAPPDGPPGLVMINPPYGGRIGNKKLLFGLYGAMGKVLSERFSGWRVGFVTSDGGLAKATGLDLSAGPPIDNGGIKIRLYQAQL
ncbi:class I SAM-dependent RNA methyltransferase [Loktanella sp. IMCC34160]|uniref:THUMP domain-containing class I SAM-dependent RNA methyltransferase n=1 Tax=Loktanella sp. IMCC34160 TaxID=2510646 RepID=UPI00101C41C0|nr:class I SAM-dependent RNA methyltransferase [Loktanella sp. IMCC34160]RYG93227.1 class I SAM-dependent RNA methyltransferase [Loktanella sp. IMCC34160]